MEKNKFFDVIKNFLTKHEFDEKHGYSYNLVDMGNKSFHTPDSDYWRVIRINFESNELRPGNFRFLKQKAKQEQDWFDIYFYDSDPEKKSFSLSCYFPIHGVDESVRQAFNGSLKALDVEDLVNKAKVRGSLFSEREFNNKLYFITVSPPWFGQEPSAQNKIRVDVVEEDEDGNQERIFIDEYTDYDTATKELKKFIVDIIEKNESVKNTFRFKLVEDKLNEIYPNEGESEKDFIARFMSVTKDEYPDVKQRYAVAKSYWKRKDKR